MYIEYLLSVPQSNDLAFAEDARPLFLHRIGEYETNWVYFIHSQTDPMLQPEFAQATVIGVWDFDGNLITTDYQLHADYFKFRPIGNDGDNATGPLTYSHAAGWGQRWLETDSLYPTGNQPFTIKIERTWDDTPAFEGWGWTATIEYVDPNRLPNARAVEVTMNSNAGNAPYTTGAFVLTEVGQDEESNPINKWQTKHQAGFVSDEHEEITVTLMFGANREGTFTLPIGQDSATMNFWEAGQTQPGQSWQDSGETVTSMAGTVTLVSDVAPFSVAQLVRIDGVEQTVQSIWAGQGLVLDPYTVNPVGAAIEVFV